MPVWHRRAWGRSWLLRSGAVLCFTADLQAQAPADADAQGLRHVAHTLKSSSASVGALKLSALCADIEGKLRDGATEGLEAQLDALSVEAGRVLDALRRP